MVITALFHIIKNALLHLALLLTNLVQHNVPQLGEAKQREQHKDTFKENLGRARNMHN